MTSCQIHFHGKGRPLEIVRHDEPALATGEVRVRVVCCTLCRSDLHTYSGKRTEPTPNILGHEIVGRVEAFGPGMPSEDSRGEPVRVGDRITWAVAVGCGACYFCREADLPQKCLSPFKYGHRQTDDTRPPAGGLAERITLLRGTFFLRLPDEIPDAVAASLNCATATAAAILRTAGNVQGRRVLILGAGVLGVTVAAMARSRGAAIVIACDPLPASRERALRFGATCAVPPDSLSECVKNLTEGRGADVVVELAGQLSAVESAFDRTRVGGTVILAGTVAPVGPFLLDPERLVRRMLSVHGVHNYHPRDLVTAVSFVAGEGRHFPWSDLVTAEFPLHEAERAFDTALRQPGERVAIRPQPPLQNLTQTP